MLMVKPGTPYLDIVREVKNKVRTMVSPPESRSGQSWLHTPCDLGEGIFFFWATRARVGAGEMRVCPQIPGTFDRGNLRVGSNLPRNWNAPPPPVSYPCQGNTVGLCARARGSL